MRTSIRRALAIAIVSALTWPWHGSGCFGAVFAPRPGPIDRPLAIAVADFDRDGRDDIVVADYQAGVLQILIGQADGTFRSHRRGPSGVGAASISVATSGPMQMVVTDLEPGDVDGDAVPNSRDNCPNIYNPADTTGRQFDSETAPGPDLQCGTADDTPALFGPDNVCGTSDDVTGDGVGEECEILEDTDGDGDVDDPIDTDGDGVLDYDPATLALDNCTRLANPAQEDTETAAGPDAQCGTTDDDPAQFGPDALCGGGDDLIGDGVGEACPISPDLIVLVAIHTSGSSLGAVRVRLNDGEGAFVNRPTYLSAWVGPGSISVDDFNGDGRPDVAMTTTTVDLVQILPGQQDGVFGSQRFLNAGDGVQGSASLDLDGDSDIDLAVGNRTANTLSVFLNAAGVLPTTASHTPATQAAAPTVLLAGDLDGNPSEDLVVLDQGAAAEGGSIEVFLGAADGTPVPGQRISLGPGHVPRAGLLRDLDGDGRLDLAVADFPGNEVLLFAGVGDGTFVTPASATIAAPGQPTSLAAIDLPAGGPGAPDLAVLKFSNRVDLIRNDGAFSFGAYPTTPASAWRNTSAMAMFGADGASGIDLVLLEGRTATITTLSGTGDGTFVPAAPQIVDGLAGPGLTPDASSLLVGDLRLNNRPDLLVLDPDAGRFTFLSNELTGALRERTTTTIDPLAAGLFQGSLVSSLVDIDRDGVNNDQDDCPTIYNPPGCAVTDPACPVEVPCAEAGDPDGETPIDCFPASGPPKVDPATGQCDSDLNGIGDHCQILSENCAGQDSDFDLIVDYNPDALFRTLGVLDFDRDLVPNTLDNCPTLANGGQEDANENGVGEACEILSGGQPVDPDSDDVVTFDPVTLERDNCPDLANRSQQDNDADGVGNRCIVEAALDSCPATINIEQTDSDGDSVGDACTVAPIDILVPNAVTNEVLLLAGDGSGTLHPTGALTGLSGPVAAATGHFALSCPLPPFFCFGRPEMDIVVAERGATSAPGDDQATLFIGDGGAFSAGPAEPLGADPGGLIVLSDQPVCPNQSDPANPNLRFDPDARSDVVAILEPGSVPTPGVRILLVSNQNFINPADSPLIPPVGRPAPLPVQAPLTAAVTIDANRDGVNDIVTLSSPPGGPTSRLTLFMGLGSGLYFTDPTLDPAPIPGELAFPAAGFIDIKTDSVYPDLALFSVTDQVPITLDNLIPERADIDRSGRIDGYDLVLLARAFGAVRGEDFTILPDATLEQTGTGATRVLVGTGLQKPGQDLPESSGFCFSGFTPLAGLYGLPVDVTLDGVVDGEDLALLASRFGASVQH